jgi:hypothetical protein
MTTRILKRIKRRPSYLILACGLLSVPLFGCSRSEPTAETATTATNPAPGNNGAGQSKPSGAVPDMTSRPAPTGVATGLQGGKKE